MTDIILHNYPASPVAEKVRVGLGIKGLSWHDVEIPRLPPKPDLVVLTGGYRRTPVMQIGADIYCDSQCILRELEARFPTPSFFARGAGQLQWGMSRWSDGELFTTVVKLVLGAAGDALDPEFAADRGRLYLGPDWSARLEQANVELPHIASQVRAHFGWLDEQLATGRDFMLGDQPAVVDALAYHVVWFVRGRWQDGPGFLSQFPALEAWEARVQSIGHGESSEMSAQAAIDIARRASTTTLPSEDAHDPQGLTVGMAVRIGPDVDGGEQAVEGRIHRVSRDTVSILRDDAVAGEVCVHFPRSGYRITIS